MRGALLAVAASATVASGAAGSTISTPTTIRPGAVIPVDFPGFREPADNRLPGGYRIVRRTARLARGERSTVVMSAPQGFRLVTVAAGERSTVGFAAVERGYAGRRSTRMRMFTLNGRLSAGETGTGTIYLLARRA